MRLQKLSSTGIFAVVIAFSCPTANAIVMDWATVGDPGNANDATGYGRVDYTYRIGNFEVTNGQYIDFLNAVAKTDTYSLYNASMSGIARSGVSENYSYAVKNADSQWLDRPVNYISYWDASRYCNWLHNGQPTGTQNALTTEGGAYTLNGQVGSGPATALISRNSAAKYFIPTENEWYKAAYYKGGGTSAGYWQYPTSHSSTPSNNIVNPDGGNNANFYQSGFTVGSPVYVTKVGEFENSKSAYGTFDQGGNVNEWNEAVVTGTSRGNRGGAYDTQANVLKSDYRGYGTPTYENAQWGFRVAKAVPTHVLSVGVRDALSNHGGDINAQRVRDAFAQLAGVQAGVTNVLALDTTLSNNRTALETAVNTMRDDPNVRAGDTFIFYLNGHGFFDSAGDEVAVSAQNSPSNPAQRVNTTGDEHFYLSRNSTTDNISDDDFSALFVDPKWQSINKLFIIDTCYAGGLWGSTTNGDTGDLARLQRVGLIAASPEGDFSFAHLDGTGLNVGDLGTAVINAVGQMAAQPSFTYQQLRDAIALQGSLLFGTGTGRIQGVEDEWDKDVAKSFALVGITSPDFEMNIAVPEPSTFVLLGIGAVGLLAWAWRRRT